MCLITSELKYQKLIQVKNSQPWILKPEALIKYINESKKKTGAAYWATPHLTVSDIRPYIMFIQLISLGRCSLSQFFGSLTSARRNRKIMRWICSKNLSPTPPPRSKIWGERTYFVVMGIGGWFTGTQVSQRWFKTAYASTSETDEISFKTARCHGGIVTKAP